MAPHSDEGSPKLALLLGALALAIIAAPFVLDLNTGWYVFAIGIGCLLLVAALSIRSPSMGGKNPIHRRGG